MRKPITFGILLFDGVEELDFMGPWEILSAATSQSPGDTVLAISDQSGPITCEKGMRVLADKRYADVINLDVLILPGGSGARHLIDHKETVSWLRGIAPGCRFVASVCTGSLLMVGAGIALGARVTTHPDFKARLAAFDGIQIASDDPFIVDGRIVSSDGMMSGLDMSLWLVVQLYGPERRAYVERYIGYRHVGAEAQAGLGAESGLRS